VDRIVVGTDLGERSVAAVATAAQMAKAMGATLHLVSVSPMQVVAMGPEAIVVPDHGALVDSTKAELEALAVDLRGQGLDVEIHAMVGDASEALCSVADKVKADLIVVGNKRMQGAGRLLGSVPNRVAHKASCSVLIAQTG
jgi:nucleotide-binding universal stress UspA family protein